ncbi:MAG: hypothetical protein JWQ71_1065, partial [Pedosphaera sp.]|nr:hypothetical protein [Pedosphaera sp.]
MKKSSKVALCIVLLFSAGIVATLFLKRGRHLKLEGERLYKQAEVQRRQVQIAKWLSQEFTPVIDNPEFA